MNPEMTQPTGPLWLVALAAWAIFLWPIIRAWFVGYCAARRAARAARLAAPRETAYRGRWR